MLDADVESNPANYHHGQLKQLNQLSPTQLPIFNGMHVYLTRNVNKENDFVNGMRAIVQNYNSRTKGVEVLTDTGHRLVVYPWSDVDLGNMVYYPMRAGYASTILKFQGSQLPYVIVYLDAPNVPGAAYTAMSRVELGEHVRLAGALTAAHFTPAR